jgi:hypothetical protein
MKTATLILLASLAGALTAAASDESSRSMRPERAAAPAFRLQFDPAQSVALFVGISSFRDDETLQSVPYAVDDAIDLAYVFALDPRVALVRPKRVVLALSDENPRKQISKRRLAELKRNGAVVVPATQSQVLKVLNRRIVCDTRIQRGRRPVPACVDLAAARTQHRDSDGESSRPRRCIGCHAVAHPDRHLSRTCAAAALRPARSGVGGTAHPADGPHRRAGGSVRRRGRTVGVRR